MRGKGFVVWAAAVFLMSLPAIAPADMKGHGGMSGTGGDHGGMMMEDHGRMKMDGHDMAKMGDKAFSGMIGSWHGDARIMDMKAHMEASGMKAQGAMPNSHHIALSLTDPKTKAAIGEGKGTITVTGPDKSRTKSEFMVMQGHFGADVNLPKPGKYTFKAEVESAGKKGSATFSYTLK